MKKYPLYKYALLLASLLMAGSLAACSPKSDRAVGNNNIITTYPSDIMDPTSVTVNPGGKPTVIPSDQALTLTPKPTGITVKPTVPILKPVGDPDKPDVPVQKPTGTPAKSEATPIPVSSSNVKVEAINVLGVTLSLGESMDSLVKKLGIPNRIVDTEYDFDYYVYNNDYKELLFVAIAGNKIVGYYTDSTDFTFHGISSGSSLSVVNTALKQSFSLAEILTLTTDQYTLKVLIDKLDTQKVTGVYVLAPTVKQDDYTDAVMKNIELLVFDLTNSIRARNGLSVLSWSSSAAMSARGHSVDMAVNNYFNHTDLTGRSPGDRMNAEGISYSTYGENIIAGYGTAILSCHGWFNSTGHRSNMLNKKFRYLGVGFSYQPDSSYGTYITQNFYRQ